MPSSSSSYLVSSSCATILGLLWGRVADRYCRRIGSRKGTLSTTSVALAFALLTVLFQSSLVLRFVKVSRQLSDSLLMSSRIMLPTGTECTVQDQFDDYRESTIGAAFLTQTISLDETTTVKFEIWDTAGQERYKSLAPMYYRNANCAVVVYDITQAVRPFHHLPATCH